MGSKIPLAKRKARMFWASFLSQIVIDAIDLVFVQYLQQLGIQTARRLQIAAEGFFHDDPAPVIVVLTHQVRRSQLLYHLPEESRCDG